jgi:hypothetical protein
MGIGVVNSLARIELDEAFSDGRDRLFVVCCRPFLRWQGRNVYIHLISLKVLLQKVLQFQSLGTLAARLSGVPSFFLPNTLPIAPLALPPAQFTVGVAGSSDVSLLLLLLLATVQRL